MSNEWKLYWLTRLDAMITLCGTVCFFSGAALVIFTVVFFVYKHNIVSAPCQIFKEGEEEAFREIRKYLWFKMAIFLFMTSTLLLVALPSRNDAILIMVGGKTLNYVQSDTSLAKIPYQTTKLIEEYLDKQLKELKKE